MASIDVDARSFEREVLESDVPVLVDFRADRCVPCERIAPALERLAAELEGRAKIATVDVDASPDLLDRYDVASLPTLVLFRNGAEAERRIGPHGLAELREVIVSSA